MSKATTPVRRPATTTTARKPAARRSGPAFRGFQMPFEDKNIIVILIGVGIIGLGYILMSMGPVMGAMSLTIAPIVLCIGYLVVVPYGIMWGATRLKKNNETLVVEEQTQNTTI
jgi:hypothetical protein